MSAPLSPEQRADALLVKAADEARVAELTARVGESR